MVSFWICGILALLSGAVATFVNELRLSLVALWLAGLAVGGVFLSVGAEYLAVVQWIVSTLLCITFLLFSSLYDPKTERPTGKFYLMSILIGLGFIAVIWSAVFQLPHGGVLEENAIGLVDLGKAMVKRNFLAIELLAVTFLIVIVGAGAISRTEPQGRKEKK